MEMATHPMQVCMETSDWLKGIVNDAGMDNSSYPSDELISCARPQPLLERRLRPPQDQALKCPRCNSAHTKFCYYNNYSLTQPRYFCKTCRRYWTKGGSLRNVPVGGGCRKNKRSTSKKPTRQPPIIHDHQPTDLHLSNLNFMFDNPSHLCDIGLGDHASQGFGIHGMNSLGFSIEGGHGVFVEGQEEANVVEVKPGNRMLSLEWPDQGCADSFGFSNGLGLWTTAI